MYIEGLGKGLCLFLRVLKRTRENESNKGAAEELILDLNFALFDGPVWLGMPSQSYLKEDADYVAVLFAERLVDQI